MSDFFFGIIYLFIGSIWYGVLNAIYVGQGRDTLDSPLPIFAVAFWPIVVPIAIIHELSMRIGKRSYARRRQCEEERRQSDREIDRIIREHQL